ncbi:hypothetical protein ACFWXK_11185 [Streptomyces sp. NPDC059070]|uniref:hypothetical protein n=1 Tax=Streptomyces sp. NPDC059070 TaxID=3346713 RepID=UPI0036A2A402
MRDGTGQVWCYSDPDACAIDVDDAGMPQTGSQGPAVPAPGQQPSPGGTPAPQDPEAEPLGFGTADEVVPDIAASGQDEESSPQDPEGDLAEAGPDDEQASDGGSKKKVKKRGLLEPFLIREPGPDGMAE